MLYWTKSKGTGGSVRSEEDFIVEEIPSRKFFSKYTREGRGIKAIDGPYVLALLKKKGVTTSDAIKIISSELHLKREDIGYAGLKDRFAVTSQYITVRKEKFREIKTGEVELSPVSFTGSMMQVGELDANKFTITLHNCKKPENTIKTIEELKVRGMPNYFGHQRFGTHGDNHLVGKFLVKGEYDSALKIISKRTGKNYANLKEVDRKMLKFFLHSYQSFLFNTVLDSYVSKNTKPSFGQFPIAGFDTKLKNDFAGKETKKLLEKDKIKTENFAIRKLNIRCTGSSRPAFVKVKNLDYTISGKKITLEFELPKGSYATVLIKEVTKI